MTDKDFCKLDTAFYGEEVDHIKQIALRTFNGEELKEYVEHCIKLHLLTIPVVVKSFYCGALVAGKDQCETQCLGCAGFDRICNE
jgi:hypothetical protein